jgi:glycine/D-amino acid oxidase-like deaminating enzyme
MIFAPDYEARCYWQDDAPLPPEGPPDLPRAVDVLIIGSGYTGLTAARETALAGRSTLVIDAGPVAGGCSSRNGGQVAFSFKPTHPELAARHGKPIADGIYREGMAANAALAALAQDEGLDFDWRPSGGFLGAHTPRHLKSLIAAFEAQVPEFAEPFEVLPRHRLSEAIDSPLYHGGVIVSSDASVHPGKLATVLYRRTIAAGASVVGQCRAESIQRTPTGFEVRTVRGMVTARQVLVATNGYTDGLSPWLQRRVMPVGSYIIATELLDPALVSRLIPAARNVGDTRRVVTYVRPSPDGRRILFGGRASAGETDVTRCAPVMHRMMTEMFPALSGVRISRAWMGFVGFTFDTRMHLGQHEGVHYCLGYCGQGVPLATYYGRHIGQRMVDPTAAPSALEGLEFPSRTYYRGRPWFLPVAVQAYRAMDWLGV